MQAITFQRFPGPRSISVFIPSVDLLKELGSSVQDRSLVNFKTEVWSTSKPKSGQLQKWKGVQRSPESSGSYVVAGSSYARHDLGNAPVDIAMSARA